MRIGLKSRILIGFLAILVTFAAASLLSIERMQRIREDLRLIHRGYLAMSRLSTQVRTLQEAKDEYVQRALTEDDPAVRTYLVGYARSFYPKALRDRLREIRVLVDSVTRGPIPDADRRFLTSVSAQLEHATALHTAYDEATVRLLETIDVANAPPVPPAPDASEGPADLVLDAGSPDAPSPSPLDRALTAYRASSDALMQDVQSLSVRFESKLAEAVLRAERTERDATYAVIVLSLIALATGALVLLAVSRGLRPLSVLLDSARKIQKGSLDVAIPEDGPEEVSALIREFNAMARVLTDRERSLAQKNADLAKLKVFAEDVIRSVRVGILVLDEDDRVRSLNPAAREVFGLPFVDVDNRPLRDLEGPPQSLMDRIGRALDALRADGAEHALGLCEVHDKVVDVALVPLRDRASAPSGDVLVLGEDVTAREQTKSKLVESERLAAIGRLAAQVTHEIRNPLSSVGLNIELLGDDIPFLPPERQAEARAILDAVGREVDRLAQITEGYLRYARLPAPSRAPGDVGDLLADLCAFSQNDAGERGVMLELHVDDALPKVPHDPQRLRQALLNLLKNAEEAAGRGGTVRLAARRSGAGVTISVEDSGPGLSDEAQARLFEPFFTTKSGGTGLGLTMTRDIVRQHGARLRVERSALGGAAFFLDLDGTPSNAGDSE